MEAAVTEPADRERELEAAVTAQWQRIEAHLHKHALTTALPLNPGAPEADIVAAEATLGIHRFPADFRASLQRHNGQASYEVLLGLGPLLSTHDIVTQWRVWKQLLDEGTFVDDDDADAARDPCVQAQWWNARWIPITHDGGGDHDCLDLDPGDGGAVGQIIQMWHDDGTRPLLAPSFLAWLTACADDLEQGRLVWQDGCGFDSTLEEHLHQ